MRKLQKKLEELLKKGYETVTINDVLQWIRYIQQDAKIKRLGLDKECTYMQYRKKPVIIDAIQWNGTEGQLINIQGLSETRLIALNDDGTLNIETLEGIMTANLHDWIIRGVANEVYPCKPDIFEQTYEPVL